MDERLEEIRARVAAATDGPWGEYHQDYNAGWYSDGVYSQDKGQWIIAANNAACAVKATPADRAFIAHARSDIPYLLDQLTQAQGRIAELGAVVEAVQMLSVMHAGHCILCRVQLGGYVLGIDSSAVEQGRKHRDTCPMKAVEEQQPTTLTKEGGGGE